MRQGFKKNMAAVMCAFILAGVSACSKNEIKAALETPKTTEMTSKETSEGPREIKPLVNHMTPEELKASGQTELKLLTKPWDGGSDDVKDKVFMGEEYGALVYGVPIFAAMPPEGYDGKSGKTTFSHYDMNDGNLIETVELEFKDYEEFKTLLRAEFDKDIQNGFPKVPADEDYDLIVKLYDAVIDGKCEKIKNEDLSKYIDAYYDSKRGGDKKVTAWEFDEEEIKNLGDSLREYSFYDAELDKTFVVHVITPPQYDPSETYRALVMTDAIWRFKDVVTLYREMEEGRAEPSILVTIGLDYGLDNADNNVRSEILCDHKKEFLDFITDNLMPYLSDIHKINFGRSCLFGHSQGGVFTHYAAFNSDLYENQPFTEYIIGSPTFWTPYFTCVSDWSGYKDDYGYFDRNDSMDKTLYLTGGSNEDEDYKEEYKGNDSTLEGLKHLKERLESRNVKHSYKLYDSNHYKYVGDMLVEYLDGKL